MQRDLGDRWTQHQRKSNKTTTQSWACINCPERPIFVSTQDLWKHTEEEHRDKFPANPSELQQFSRTVENDFVARRKHTHIEAEAEAGRPQSLAKRPLNSPQPTRSLSGLQQLNLGPKNEDTTIDDSPEDITADQPRKRAAVGDGISAGSASREASGSPPPQRSKAQAPQSPMDIDYRRQTPTFQRPKGQLWTPDQDSPFTRSSVDPSNIASIQANKTRAQAMEPSTRGVEGGAGEGLEVFDGFYFGASTTEKITRAKELIAPEEEEGEARATKRLRSTYHQASPEVSAPQLDHTTTDIYSDTFYHYVPPTSSMSQTSIENPVFKLDRTMTDIFLDELQQPSFSITPDPPLKFTSIMHTSANMAPQNEILSQGLQTARSQQRYVALEKSPFREGSQLTPSSIPFSTQSSNIQLGTQVRLKEQHKTEDDARVLQRQFEKTPAESSIPETTSPKDVDLVYYEDDDDANMSLFPPAQQIYATKGGPKDSHPVDSNSFEQGQKGSFPTDDPAKHGCSHPGCTRSFHRLEHLRKHAKTHSRPWKCPETTCRYHTLGWPTERELDRHVNDKHTSSPSYYKCHYDSCQYVSKRESNCKQHMEKAHNWEYVRSKKASSATPHVPSPLENTPGTEHRDRLLNLIGLAQQQQQQSTPAPPVPDAATIAQRSSQAAQAAQEAQLKKELALRIERSRIEAAQREACQLQQQALQQQAALQQLQALAREREVQREKELRDLGLREKQQKELREQAERDRERAERNARERAQRAERERIEWYFPSDPPTFEIENTIFESSLSKEPGDPSTSSALEDFSLFPSTSQTDHPASRAPEHLFSMEPPYILQQPWNERSNNNDAAKNGLVDTTTIQPPDQFELFPINSGEVAAPGTVGFERSDHAPHIDDGSPISPETTPDREDWDLQSIKSISTFRDSAVGSSIPSSSSASSVQELPRAAQNEILFTMESDAQLQCLFKELAKRIDKARFIRNIRRLLISFTVELKQNASDPRERDVVNIIERHASWFASRFFDLSDPNKDSHSQLMAMQLNQQTDKCLLLEKYLSSNMQRSARAATPMGEDDEADEGDKADVEAIEINYSKFPNLEHIKKFIVGGTAFDRLRSNTLLFAKNGQGNQQEAAFIYKSVARISNNESDPLSRTGRLPRWAQLVRRLILIQRFLGILKTRSQQQSKNLHLPVDQPRCSSQISSLNSSNEGDDISMGTDAAEDSETDSTDYDSDDLPDDPVLSYSAEERILNPRGYFQKLEDLEREVFQNSNVFIHKMGRSMSPQEDEALLLLPESTTYYFDRGAFIVEIIKKTESGKLLHLLECHNTIHRSMTNLTLLQENGYCGSSLSILTTDETRSDVVKLVSVQVQEILDLAKSFVDIIKTFASDISTSDPGLDEKVHSFVNRKEAEYSLTTRCWELLVNMGIIRYGVWDEPMAIWSLTAQVIELAIISYAGAHIERFDESLLGRETTFTIRPRRIYYDDMLTRIGQKVPNCPSCMIKFSRRKLQCMDSLLNGKQPWVFHSQRPYTKVGGRLYLSTNIESLTDLWGPSWKIVEDAAPNEIKQYDIGNGAIIPWSAESSNFDWRPILMSSEVFCHWISSRSWNENEVERHQASLKRRCFLSTDTLLIGAQSNYGLLTNEKCVPSMQQISRFKTKLWDQQALRPPNVSRAKRYIDSHAVQIQGSAMGFVSSSGQITYKRRSGHTMKAALVERWRHGLRNPIDLEAYSGVEISLCSRNAIRRRLLNILGSNTMVNYLHGISFSWISDICKESFLKALRCPKSFRKFWKMHKEWQANIGDAISKCLDALEETGIDDDSQELSAFWVESFDEDGDSDGEADDESVVDSSDKDDNDDNTAQGPTALPTPPDSTHSLPCSKFFEEWIVTLFRSEHTWTGFLQDSEESLTMAVVGMTCLDFHDQDGFGRNCSMSPKAKGYPVLQTSLHVNESIISSCKLKQEKVGSGQKTIWNANELKQGTSLPLGNHGKLEVLSASSKLCPVIVEWKGVKSELLKEVKNVAINEKLLGRGAEKHHHEFIRGTWEVKPLPILVLSKSTKVRFSKD
ncbi:hypothetical protein ACMFMF_010013 [Clarireedia jacksonii]